MLLIQSNKVPRNRYLNMRKAHMHHLEQRDNSFGFTVSLYQMGRPGPMVVKSQDRETAMLVYKMAADLSWIDACLVREGTARIASFSRRTEGTPMTR